MGQTIRRSLPPAHTVSLTNCVFARISGCILIIDLHAKFQDADFLHTPTSSAISLSSGGSHTPQPPLGMPSTPKASAGPAAFPSRSNLTPTPASGAKKIFGRIFKKKEGQGSPTGSVGGHSRGGSIDTKGRLFVSPPTSDIGHGNGPSEEAASPSPSHISFNTPSGGGGLQQLPLLQPAVLGIQPTLSAPVNPPSGRPTRYVWIIRKWLKNGDGGLLGGVMRGVNMVGAQMGKVGGLSDRFPIVANGNGHGGGGEMGVEVRFEWVRGQSKNQDKRKSTTGQAALGKRFSVTEEQNVLRSRRSRRSMGENVGAGQREKSKSRDPPVRRSGESRRSIDGPLTRERERDSRTNSITSATVSEEAQQALKAAGLGIPPGIEEDDEGEESDPEDSETPWSCTLIVSSIPSNPITLWENEVSGSAGGEHMRGSSSRLSHVSASEHAHAHAHARPTSSQGRPVTPTPAGKTRSDAPGTLLKLKIGALSPAPHHPKVVAQLKVPFPLPDVEVETARVMKRVVTPAGVSRPAPDEGRARPMSRSSGGGGGGAVGARPVSRSGNGGRGGSPFRGGGMGGNRSGGDGVETTVLTAEEIKDVLSCTAFWVVVREGFGGVGKEKRKGDGWRIRG